MLLSELSWVEFERARKHIKTVIVPLGPVEEHGPQLPLGTDFLQPFEFAKLLAKKRKAFIFPVLPLGVCRSTKSFPGTISISPRVLSLVLEEICNELIRQGMEKILIVNGHWGTKHVPAILSAIKKVKKSHGKIKLASFNLFEHSLEKFKGQLIEANDGHAGEFETSCLLFLKPELVRKGKLVQDVSPQSKKKDFFENPRKYWKTGVNGNAKKASAKKGKLLVEEELKFVLKLLDK